MAPKNTKKNSNKSEKGTPAYQQKRQRNNLAVKKSRVKSKLRARETMDKVEKLKVENEKLEEKIKMLSSELNFLKNLFVLHAGSNQNFKLSTEDNNLLEQLLQDEDPAEFSNACGEKNVPHEEEARIHALQVGETLDVGVHGVRPQLSDAGFVKPELE